MVYLGKYCITILKAWKDSSTTLTYLQILKVYGCETWSLTLKEEYRLIVPENRALRNILGLVG